MQCRSGREELRLDLQDLSEADMNLTYLHLTLCRIQYTGSSARFVTVYCILSFIMALLKAPSESQGRQPFYLWKKRAGQFEFLEY